MRIVINPNKSASFNMAAEEYMLKSFEDDVFMLWQADRTVLIGKNQNTRKEIDMDYVEQNKIRVVRRLSGGGAVYNDLGNTNFAFISTDTDGDGFSNFRKFTAPILELLNLFGVPAEFSGRNDLLVDGKKFSGNAQYKHKNRLLHHGTLLFSSSMEELAKALSPDMIKFKSKGIDSVKSRVTNISEHLSQDMRVETFMQRTNEYILNTFSGSQFYTFSAKDIEEIRKLEALRFSNWAWNFGASPQYDFSNQDKFPGGLVEVSFQVKNGHIKNVRIFGDFFSEREIEALENTLNGLRHETGAIRAALTPVNINDFISGITLDDFLTLFN